MSKVVKAGHGHVVEIPLKTKEDHGVPEARHGQRGGASLRVAKLMRITEVPRQAEGDTLRGPPKPSRGFVCVSLAASLLLGDMGYIRQRVSLAASLLRGDMGYIGLH